MSGIDAPGKTVLRTAAVILTIIMAAFLCYSNTFSASFHFDDYDYVIKYNQQYPIESYWPPHGTRYFTYLTFALNYMAGGLDVRGYHAVNLAIHAFNGILVFFMASLIMRTPRLANRGLPSFHIAVIAALLFTAHPVQTQAVTYISQRFASLATLLYLIGITAYLKWRLSEARHVRHAFYVLSLSAVHFAQMTKEISFTLPFVLLISEMAFFHGALKRRLLLLTPFMLAMAVIPWILFMPGDYQGVGSSIIRDQLSDLGNISRHDYLVTQFRVVVTYLRLLALPVDQTFDYDYPMFSSVFAPEVFASFLFIVFLFSCALYMFYRFLRGGSAYFAILAAGVVWFFITISVESSIIPINDVIFEHRLYLPSAGAALFFSAAIFFAAQRLGQAPWKTLTAAFLLAVLPLGAASYARNRVWHDGVALYEDNLLKSPGKERVRFNLGRAYFRDRQFDKAIEQYKESIRLKPDNEKSHYDLGVIYMVRGETEPALYYFRETLKLTPADPKVHNYIALMYALKGEPEKAVEFYSNAIEILPDFEDAHFNLALVLMEKGDFRGAEYHLRAALSLNPSSVDVIVNLCRLYSRAGEAESAAQFCNQAMAARPDLAGQLAEELK